VWLHEVRGKSFPMAWDEAFTCDICGKTKMVANHWWMATLGDAACCDEGQPLRSFTLLPWNDSVSRNSDIYHLCGSSCATKALERFMTAGTLVLELPRPIRD